MREKKKAGKRDIGREKQRGSEAGRYRMRERGKEIEIY